MQRIRSGFTARLLAHTIAALVLCLSFTTFENARADESPPTVLITGANRGIGFEFARQYAADRWHVIATARKPDDAEDLNKLADQYPNLVIERLDVRDLAMIDAFADKYSDQPIDVLLNNAAISGSPRQDQTFRHINYELFNAFMETNAQGPLKMSEAFLKNVQNSEQKKIVVVTSRAGLFSNIDAGSRGTYFYRASKAALNMLMLQVAGDVKKRGITVVLLNPGLVDTQGVLTEMNEKMKLGLTLTPIGESIAGMRKVIDATGLDESGNVYQWTGEQLDF